MKERLKLTLKAWPLITLVTVGLCFLTGAVAESAFGIKLESQQSVEFIRALVRRLCANAGWHKVFFKDLATLVLLAAQVVLILPALEEVLFRWILWRLPRPAIPIVPAITSSALFSAAHYIQMPWPNDAFVALFFFGMAQCWLYARTGALWCPILNHALFNATNLVLIFVLPS